MDGALAGKHQDPIDVLVNRGNGNGGEVKLANRVATKADGDAVEDMMPTDSAPVSVSKVDTEGYEVLKANGEGLGVPCPAPGELGDPIP